MTVAQRAERLRERIAAVVGEPRVDEITVVAVTKRQDLARCSETVAAGFEHLGENYVAELVDKALRLTARWHFIGQLQTNKVRKLAGHVWMYQSVDRVRVAEMIASHDPGARCLVQVNLAGEPHRGGVSWEDLDKLIDRCVDLGLKVEGLMGVGPHNVDPPETARSFTLLRSAVDSFGLETCSMGMSGDLEIALDCGATMVRIGSDLVGRRDVF